MSVSAARPETNSPPRMMSSSIDRGACPAASRPAQYVRPSGSGARSSVILKAAFTTSPSVAHTTGGGATAGGVVGGAIVADGGALALGAVDGDAAGTFVPGALEREPSAAAVPLPPAVRLGGSRSDDGVDASPEHATSAEETNAVARRTKRIDVVCSHRVAAPRMPSRAATRSPAQTSAFSREQKITNSRPQGGSGSGNFHYGCWLDPPEASRLQALSEHATRGRSGAASLSGGCRRCERRRRGTPSPRSSRRAHAG